MIFRQLFDPESCTYTYLIASRVGGEAMIIDPVLDRVDRYVQLIDELDLELVRAIDTHVHADHISGLGALRDRTQCVTMMGEQSAVDVVSIRIADGDPVEIEGGIRLDAMYTPGHTDDSYSFLFGDRVFTGDTLFIRGTGRTDFQNGDPRAQYDSIFNRLLRLPDETLVYPAHDYKGDTVSTIGEERRFNPRLQVRSVDEYVDIMNSLDLADPKMMDVAVPANLRLGMSQDGLANAGLSLAVAELRSRLTGAAPPLLVDLREDGERDRHGEIAGGTHVPYTDIDEQLEAGGLLRTLCEEGRDVVFYCAFGERSALALQMAREAGIDGVYHLAGGLDAWAREGAEVERGGERGGEPGGERDD
ncbi:MAG: MBL fold metallo-hydrolase [Thermoanaerobaculia bacterium]|nr:MBL fold metallo-hydrolase [Thermoanaerobaculia bacterium]